MKDQPGIGSLIAVIAGAALWGIPGMFLSILIVAILKLLFDRIDSMKHWGFLMGEMPAAESKPDILAP